MRIAGFTLFAIALAAPAVAIAAEDGNERNQRMVCRQTATTGSILRGQRVCRTQAEWDNIAERDRERRDQNRQTGNATTASRQ